MIACYNISLECNWHGTQIRLDNGARVRVNIFIVHEEAREVSLAPREPGGAPCKRFQWTAVVRSQCKKGCQVRWQVFCGGWARPCRLRAEKLAMPVLSGNSLACQVHCCSAGLQQPDAVSRAMVEPGAWTRDWGVG